MSALEKAFAEIEALNDRDRMRLTARQKERMDKVDQWRKASRDGKINIIKGW